MANSNSHSAWRGKAETVPGVVKLGAYGRERMFGRDCQDAINTRQRKLRNALIEPDELIGKRIERVQKLKRRATMNLTDTQMIILQGAMSNDDGNILPISKSCKAFGVSLTKSIEKLYKEGLILKIYVGRNEPHILEDDVAYSYTITNAGRIALGYEPEEEKMTTHHIEEVHTIELPLTKGEIKAKAQADNLARRAIAAAARVEALREKARVRAEKDAARGTKEAAGDNRKKNAPFVDGKRLFALTDTNHHREGSKAHASLAIIHKYPGILFEEYLTEGGKLQDLAMDLVRGYVEVVVADADALSEAA